MAEVPRRSATILDVATHAGVSKSAVSRALLNQPDVSPQTRERVLQSVRELGYVANAMAQGLSSPRTHRVGLLIRNSSNPAYGAMHTALQRRADEIDMAIVAMTVASTDVTPAIRVREQKALSSLISLQVDGLIICSGTMPSSDVEPFLSRLPIISVARPESSPLINAISYDEEYCGRQLADHVAGLGHQKVAVFYVPTGDSINVHLRCVAMVRQLRRRGVDVVKLPAPTGAVTAADLQPVLADPEITALMCAHDVMLIQTLALLRTAGVDVPGRLSVTGCDSIGILGSEYLGLTSFALPVQPTAERAIDLMQQLTAKPFDLTPSSPVIHTKVRGSMVVGRTTGEPWHLIRR